MTDNQQLAIEALHAAVQITTTALNSPDMEFQETAQEFFTQVFDRAIDCLRKVKAIE